MRVIRKTNHHYCYDCCCCCCCAVASVAFEFVEISWIIYACWVLLVFVVIFFCIVNIEERTSKYLAMHRSVQLCSPTLSSAWLCSVRWDDHYCIFVFALSIGREKILKWIHLPPSCSEYTLTNIRVPWYCSVVRPCNSIFAISGTGLIHFLLSFSLLSVQKNSVSLSLTLSNFQLNTKAKKMTTLSHKKWSTL